MTLGVQKARVWARSLLAPRERLLPGVGARLARHPRALAGVLVGVRRLPTERLRAFGYTNLSRPLIRRVSLPVEVPVARGSRMVANTGDVIGRGLAVTGMWEPAVTQVFEDVLSPGDVCVDVGANIGYFTLLASRLVGQTGRVYAIEPGAEAHAALLANLKRNATANVVPLRVAAGAAEGFADLFDPPPGNLGSASLIERAAMRRRHPSGDIPAERVRVLPLPAILEHEDQSRVRLVKIDVEGFEWEVLRGLEPLLRSGAEPAIVVELALAYWADSDRAFLTTFSSRYGLRPLQLPSGTDGGRHSRLPADIATLSGDLVDLLLAPAWLVS